jgi:hypothetical protein
VLLLAVLLVAYLPLSTFYFGMKNDAFSDNFPNKFFFTETISSGFLPLWNPYLNFGFPIYADPGFAFWHPITWLFGVVIKYNAYTLTIEVLLYLYIAGISMYRLGRYLSFTNATAFTIAVMYMCSGFFTGQLQHINFLTAAAFLPFLLQQFLVLFQCPCRRNACLTALAYYFVFACGHPAIPIGTVYFLLTLTAAIVILNNKPSATLKKVLLYQSLAVALFIVLYSPAIYSYANITDEYGRGGEANQFDAGAINAGFSPSSWLSFLYPFSTVKNAPFFTDDLAMRNSYFSIAGFILVLTQIRNKSYLMRALFISSLVMLLLSCGGFIKGVVFSNLPLLTYIRTNGEFRIFSILCFCVIAGHGLNNLNFTPRNSYEVFRKTVIFMLSISLLATIYIAFENTALLLSSSSRSFYTTSKGIKGLIDSLTFTDALLISLIINCLCLFFILLAKADHRKITLIILIDLIANSIAYLPFSGIGKVTLAEIQSTYNKSEKGIIIPPLIPIKNIDTLSSERTGLVGNWSFYNKQIGSTSLTDYPSYFSNTEKYFNSDLPAAVNNYPYIFLKSDFEDSSPLKSPNKTLKVKFYSPQKIVIEVDALQDDSLVLLQNRYKFWRANADGQELEINPTLITFMSVPLRKGRHIVGFYYQDKWLILFTTVSITSFLILLLFIFKTRKSNLVEATLSL